MAKSKEDYETILDELSLLKEKDNAIDGKLASIESVVTQMAMKDNEQKSQPKLSSEELQKMDEASYKGVKRYFGKNPNEVVVLSAANLQKMKDALYESFSKAQEESDAELKEFKEEDNRQYEEDRTKQGIGPKDQVATWAPEYSEPVRRAMRFIGRKTLNQHESPEKAQAIMRVWGDAL